MISTNKVFFSPYNRLLSVNKIKEISTTRRVAVYKYEPDNFYVYIKDRYFFSLILLKTAPFYLVLPRFKHFMAIFGRLRSHWEGGWESRKTPATARASILVIQRGVLHPLDVHPEIH